MFSIPGLNAQNVETQKKSIDSLYTKVVPALVRQGKFEEAVSQNIEIIKLAEKIGYKKIVPSVYLAISNSLGQLGNYKESLRYLDLAESLAGYAGYPGFEVRVLEGYARNYMGLQLNGQSIEHYNKAIALYHKKKLENTILLGLLYKNKAAVLDNDGQVDSSLFYLRKAFKLRQTPFDYISLAYHHIGTLKNLDSAEYFLNRAKQQMVLSPPSEYDKIVLNINLGKLYKSRKEYEKALEYFDEAVNLSKETKLVNKLVTAYSFIHEIYELMGNDGKSHEYLGLYTHLKDSINTERSAGFNLVVDRFLEEQEKEYESNRRKLRNTIIAILIGSLLVLGTVYIYFHKKRKARTKLIKEKEKETLVLREKINDAFGEVAQLAMENSPLFLARFQEVYPEVCEKLLKVNPNLVNTELSLCAMIYLNFSSKEIAQYTFVQPKTVQVKKYRLRKKLGIPKNIDLYNWMKMS